MTKMTGLSGEKFLISCRDATFLIAQKRGKPIGLRDWTRLIVHLTICEFCRRFSKQTRMIEKQVLRIQSGERLTVEEKERMSRVIKRSREARN